MPARTIGYLAAIALWALPIGAGAQSPSTPSPEVLRVTRTADDGGEGSLRWAIERNNAAPGRFGIEIAPAGQAPYVIKLASPLPAIKGPVAIEGAPWKRSGEFVALDGSSYIEDKGPQTCPGAVPGQYGNRAASTNALSASAASASLRHWEVLRRFVRMARLIAKRGRMEVSNTL
jgi:3-dehydroshikimate dehydratase